MPLHRIKYCFSFLIRTLGVCFLVGLGAALLAIVNGETFDILFSVKWLLFFMPVAGIPVDFLYREFFRKDEYYFYYNLGINKLTLWLFNISIISVFCFILYKIAGIWI